MISLVNLTKIYKRERKKIKAVDGLNLEVRKGEICILVGPSGCGKTTTLKVINKLVEPTDGKVFIDGKDTTELNITELRRNIGYVIQEVGLFPHMTVAENIACVPHLRGWQEERIKRRVDELLSLVGMEPKIFKDKYPRELSGGQCQRVGVARALGADPPILLMDEPFGAIDPITRVMLQGEFLKIQKRLKKTVVFVTHDINEAIKVGDSIALMCDAKLVQYDSPEKILLNPKNEFVKDFVGRDRALKCLQLLTVDDVNLEKLPADTSLIKRGKTISDEANLIDVLSEMLLADGEELEVVDKNSQVKGYLTIRNIREALRLVYSK